MSMFKMFDQRFALNDIQSTRETIKYGISFIIHSCIRRLLKEVPFYHVYQCVRIRWKTATLQLTYALCTYNSLHARIRSTSSSQQIYRMVSNIHQIIHLSWELTYPLPKHFQRCIFLFPRWDMWSFPGRVDFPAMYQWVFFAHCWQGRFQALPSGTMRLAETTTNKPWLFCCETTLSFM